MFQITEKRLPSKTRKESVKAISNKLTHTLKEVVMKAAKNVDNKIGEDGLIS
ncbi:hypothetical protein [Bartonella gliris]|uniref:hypothetical protein n=1 Tax=Bartonella gliris TaxID=3004109 RepID=UPI00295E58BD|nr:hypothetical protein [Bartonella gliris]